MIQLLLMMGFKLAVFFISLLWFLFWATATIMLLGAIISILIVAYDVYKESSVK